MLEMLPKKWRACTRTGNSPTTTVEQQATETTARTLLHKPHLPDAGRHLRQKSHLSSAFLLVEPSEVMFLR